MRVEAKGKSGKGVVGTPLLQPKLRVKGRAVPDLCANSSWRAVVRCPAVGHNRIESQPRRFRFRLSTTRQTSRRKLFKPGKALVLAVSESSARRDQCL